MTNQGVSKLAFQTLDRLTDRYPSVVPSFFQKILLAVAGNRIVYLLYLLKYRAALKRVKSFDRILLIADVNIGDAITIQQCVAVFRHFFPASIIDYVCNQTGGELLRGMPDANHVYRVFNSSRGFPLQDDLRVLTEIVQRTNYTFIACFSPFVPKKEFQKYAQFVQMYVPLASHIFRRWKENNSHRHVSEAVFEVTRNLLEPMATSGNNNDAGQMERAQAPSFKGNSVYLTPQGIHRAHRFLADHMLSPEKHLLFFNPDATSRYSQIPLGVQMRILKIVLETETIDTVLLGSGHSSDGIETALATGIPHTLRKKLVIVPRLPIGVYAALIDACDMFLSSDTGPAHIAASRKVALSEYGPVRNQTSVVTVFGAGDSRMYGYDSGRAEYLRANQLVPSKVFEGRAPCRNITCVNKWGKSCGEIRCFVGIDAQEITDYVVAYFGKLSKKERVPLRRVV
jgi:ADP-heptose:LPS heptosyltransferase